MSESHENASDDSGLRARTPSAPLRLRFLATCGEALRPAARPSGILATLLGAFALALLCSWAAIPYALRTPSGADDVNWAKRSLDPWWFPYERSKPPDWEKEYERHVLEYSWHDPVTRDYSYCVEHPSLARIIYRSVLSAAGIERIDQLPWDLTKGYDWNIREGRILPSRPLTLLRMTNFAFFLGGALLVYLGLVRLTGSPILSLLAALPLALEPTAIRDPVSVVEYIGSDAMLSFWVAAVWLVWVCTAAPRLSTTLLLGVLAGLATSTKLNGAFVLPGLMAGLAAAARGPKRIIYPTMVPLIAFIVFAALNPVVLGPSLSWTVGVLSDMLHVRSFNEHWIAARAGTFGKGEAILAVFPYVYFILPVVGVLAACSREKWFGRAALFSLSVMLCNCLVIPTMMARYAFPVRQAFWMLFLPCAAFALSSLCHRASESLCAPSRQFTPDCTSKGQGGAA